MAVFINLVLVVVEPFRGRVERGRGEASTLVEEERREKKKKRGVGKTNVILFEKCVGRKLYFNYFF